MKIQTHLLIILSNVIFKLENMLELEIIWIFLWTDKSVGNWANILWQTFKKADNDFW